MVIFSIKYIPYEFWFCTSKCYSKSKFGPFVWNGPHSSAPYPWVSNCFHKMDPLLIWVLYSKLLNYFQIGPFWTDWQTPQLSKWPTVWGPKYLFRFWTENCGKNFKLVSFGSIGRLPIFWLPIFQNGPQLGAPNNYDGYFFNKIYPQFYMDIV